MFVQTLGCGLERITGIDTSEPKSKLVYLFPGNWCGVPTIVGHYLVQSVPAVHGFIDQSRGVLRGDEAFRDVDGQPGFSFSERDWPHGWRGVGTPHGAVFTR